AAGVGSVMTCHVAFPALDPSGVPATLSSAILHRLRDDFSFGGLIVTDALNMAGARGEDALVRALGAGCDLLLYPVDTAAAVHAVEAAITTGRLRESEITASVMRAERAASHWSNAPVTTPRGRFRDPAALADGLLERPLLRGASPRLRGGIDLVVVDDDIGGAWPASPSDYLARALRAAGTPLGGLGDRVVLAFAEPRASKGRAGFSDEHRRRLADLAPDASLVVLFGHPRLLSEIPGPAPVLLAWHRQRLMQEAVARWLVARLA
ncbi:MAG: glycoside hydrolase family 3 N-terminal domain-containing protein, partial [Gemmatimonadales bacterium]